MDRPSFYSWARARIQYRVTECFVKDCHPCIPSIIDEDCLKFYEMEAGEIKSE